MGILFLKIATDCHLKQTQLCSSEVPPPSLLLGRSENFCRNTPLSLWYQVLLLGNSETRSIVQWMLALARVLVVIFQVGAIKRKTAGAAKTRFSFSLPEKQKESPGWTLFHLMRF